MNSTKKPLYLVFLIIDVVFAIPCAVFAIMSMLDDASPVFLKLGAIISFLGIIFALVYVILGYSKEMGVAFKAYLVCFLGSLFVSILLVASTDENVVVQEGLYSLMFAFVMVMTLGKNIGRRISIIYCLIIFVLSILLLLNGMIAIKDSGLNMLITWKNSTYIMQAILLFTITIAKYEDKRMRNTN